MSHLVYKGQPATRTDLDNAIQSLVSQLAEAVEEKVREDPSFSEVASLVDQIAKNILHAEENADAQNS